MISDFLIPALKREFAGWEISFGSPPQPIATFPACQEAVGEVVVCDDGDEVTVYIGKITHGHFSDDETLNREEKENSIAEDVIHFLKALFADRVLFSRNMENGENGSIMLDYNNSPIELSPSRRYFLWTKPYEPQ